MKIVTSIQAVVVATIVLTASVQAQSSTCTQKNPVTRWGCKTGEAARQGADYVREHSPEWRKSAERAVDNTRQAADNFRKGLISGWRSAK
jgi:hypothetical protein